jgi:hypothetical protein
VRRALLLFCLCVLTASGVHAQTVHVGLSPRTIHVGDVFNASMQITVPAGTVLFVPDTLDVTGDVENAARKRVRVDTLQSGDLHYLVSYPLTAWRPGTDTLPPITATLIATLRGPKSESSITVRMPIITVSSVLPADTANIQPKDPRDVWGANRLWWPFVVAALLALLLIGLLIWWWRRRRQRKAEEPIPLPVVIHPREWALRELDRIAAARLIERGDLRFYYIELSEVLRKFLGMLDSAWGTDLTTNELSDRFIALRVSPGALFGMLDRADLVKFARQRPPSEQARKDLETARSWVQTFEKPAPALSEAA